MLQQKINIFWFRRDLRLEDNAGLSKALQSGLPVLPIFIFDRNILDELEDKMDRRVSFIYAALEKIQKKLLSHEKTLEVFYGKPEEVFKKIITSYQVDKVFTNHDYEPYARKRDNEISQLLKEKNIGFETFKDQVIFEKSEVMKEDGTPYSVFTPYSTKWKSLLVPASTKSFSSGKLVDKFLSLPPKPLPTLDFMGFQKNSDCPRIEDADEEIIRHYHKTRNIPFLEGTTRMGIHLRFGTVSIRQLAAKAIKLNPVFLNELIWREFFMQTLWHQPRLVTQCFKLPYEKIQWRNREDEFEKWCRGETGYPIVDAGMRELNNTGFMHNRVRMITASFLVKHLLIDWRWGESYFASKLADFELSSNNGNWQWVAGCGCDAAPYFRIFNPSIQAKKFDPQNLYIRKWVKEFDSLTYPLPMVDHAFARDRCLKVYKMAVGSP